MLHSSELVRRSQVCNSHRETGSEKREKTIHRATPLNSEKPASQSSIAALPLVTYQVGETVIADGSKSARLLILKKGAVTIVKEDTEIATVTEPGAVFGELSILLDQPEQSRRACPRNLAVLRSRRRRPSDAKSDRHARCDGVSAPARQRE